MQPKDLGDYRFWQRAVCQALQKISKNTHIMPVPFRAQIMTKMYGDFAWRVCFQDMAQGSIKFE